MSPDDSGNGSTASSPARQQPQLEIPPRKRSGLDSIFLGPHGVRAGWRIALYLVLTAFFAAILQFAETLLGVPLVRQIGELTPAILFSQEIVLVGAALGAAAVMSLAESRPFGDYGTPLRSAFGARFWQGILFGTIQVSLMMLLIAVLRGYSFGGLAIVGADVARYAANWAGTFLLVGIFEEFFFRGYLQFTLASATHFWPAATALSLLFGAVHLANPGEGPVGAASVFVIGMFLCFTLRRTGNLWFAIGWHAAFDFGETYIYGVPDSGFVARGHLIAASIHGPRWITGGSVGPEGSVAAFATVALAFLIFDRIYRAQPKS